MSTSTYISALLKAEEEAAAILETARKNGLKLKEKALATAEQICTEERTTQELAYKKLEEELKQKSVLIEETEKERINNEKKRFETAYQAKGAEIAERLTKAVINVSPCLTDTQLITLKNKGLNF